MDRLKKAVHVMLKDCLKIKKGEKLLVITDDNYIELSNIILKEALKIAEAKLLNIPVGKRSGEEPPDYVAKEMKRYENIIMITSHSLTHTKAAREANRKKAKIISSPTLTKDTMKRCIDIDYEKLKKISDKLRKILDKGKQVRITTEKGTDIRFSIEGRKSEGWRGIQKRTTKNLPTGEVFLAPVEGTAEGKAIFDGSILNFKIKRPIEVEFRKGYAKKITGKDEAKILKITLDNVKDKNAYNLAELGIGINPKAKITGNVLEDEKVKGTCHLAFGNNKGFGGKINVPVHIDGIILKPTIFIDGKIIIKDGEFLF